MTYLCPPYTQIDGSLYQQLNCVCASVTELMDLSSVGRIRIPAYEVRRASQDTSGGVELSTASVTSAVLSKNQATLTSMYALTRAEFKDVIRSGHHAGIIIDCSITVGTKFRTNYYTGNHAVVVAANSYRAEDDTFAVEDPGTVKAGWLRWPAKLLMHAAEAAGGGFIYILRTKDTEAVTRTVRIKARLRANPDITSTSKGIVNPGQKFWVHNTLNGGPWRRPDGTVARGWHRVKVGTTGVAYLKGEALL
jgi:hypothetical protein